MSNLPIKNVVVHCSATKAEQNITARDIDRWHRQQGWLGIGYHYVIRRDGTVEKGRTEDRVGSHVAGHNRNALGICLAGGLDSAGKPQANFTDEQYTALAQLIVDIKARHGEQLDVLGHRDFPGVAKACPCFDVRSWVKSRGI